MPGRLHVKIGTRYQVDGPFHTVGIRQCQHIRPFITVHVQYPFTIRRHHRGSRVTECRGDGVSRSRIQRLPEKAPAFFHVHHVTVRNRKISATVTYPGSHVVLVIEIIRGVRTPPAHQNTAPGAYFQPHEPLSIGVPLHIRKPELSAHHGGGKRTLPEAKWRRLLVGHSLSQAFKIPAQSITRIPQSENEHGFPSQNIVTAGGVAHLFL